MLARAASPSHAHSSTPQRCTAVHRTQTHTYWQPRAGPRRAHAATPPPTAPPAAAGRKWTRPRTRLPSHPTYRDPPSRPPPVSLSLSAVTRTRAWRNGAPWRHVESTALRGTAIAAVLTMLCFALAPSPSLSAVPGTCAWLRRSERKEASAGARQIGIMPNKGKQASGPVFVGGGPNFGGGRGGQLGGRGGRGGMAMGRGGMGRGGMGRPPPHMMGRGKLLAG